MYQLIQDEVDFLVISKSANVHFHSQDGEAGVVARVESDLNLKLYPVHRLDTLTSGLIILAKSSEVAAHFTRLFSAHKVQKYYLALAMGKPKKKQGWVIGDMAKSRRSQYKLLRTTQNPAVTQFFTQSVADGLRLYLLKPLSGKTHQLRVALASLGCPILGDAVYGGESADRGYLHAWQLEFNYQGQNYQFCTEPTQGELFDASWVKQQLAQWTPVANLPWPKSKA
ncbi:MAG: TIGR01621 family pseudouridine synthase [Shewanella sp.]|nr:TIGR01621 family pseudouridine synthase [Shewanella sp.]MCF1439508.1 TIGR01621 family pseudouridine synthase [Shewanella sp.]MCF1458264.1 TIGR01621 family pseudouridine synthase [Shewanella sp.]